MSTTTIPAGSPTAVIRPDMNRAARTTGLLYLGLAITGLLGMMIVRNQLLIPDDPAATLVNLQAHEWLARAGIVLEMGVVLTQALTALWFYRLFRSVDAFAAGSLAAFGLVNTVAILGSAAMLATALEVAGDPSLANAATVQVLYAVSGHLWGVGAMFFGLWLIPMGWLAIRSHWLPAMLGRLLVVGGVGYLLSAFVTYLFRDADVAAQLLTIPATVGEFWILGYLIIVGLHPQRRSPHATS